MIVSTEHLRLLYAHSKIGSNTFFFARLRFLVFLLFVVLITAHCLISVHLRLPCELVRHHCL